ncbi:MAG: hypothetical protein IPK24_19005 [Kineosporiaceae bacterium]|nr:hypothetical protein [Kineosporiaceae bacterium]MBK8077596.1 hypothetical protein [Kineosporiaceae bacterium]
MSDEVLRVELVNELQRLVRRGSGTENLALQQNLLALEPVKLAAKGDGVTPAFALFALLSVLTDVKAGPGAARDLLVAAALTGVSPRDETRGVRNDSSGRIAAAEAVKGSPRLDVLKLREGREPYLGALADEIILFSRAAQRTPEVLAPFLRACLIPDGTIRSMLGEAAHATLAASSHAVEPLPVSPEIVNPTPFPMNAGVLRALEKSRLHCAAVPREYYTPDLLRALMSLRDRRVSICLQGARPGLADEVEVWLRETVDRLDEQAEPDSPPDWTLRPELEHAHQLAQQDGRMAISELHLFLAVLDGDSGTARVLTAMAGRDFPKLRRIADEARRRPPAPRPTPGLHPARPIGE